MRRCRAHGRRDAALRRMKRAAWIPLLFLVSFCAGSGGGQSQVSSLPGHGAISIAIVPNPIVAQPVGGNTYDFPFDVIVHETGGHPVNVTRVSADVTALGGVPIATESYDAAKINGLGYSTTIPANGELRYHFVPRKEVADERLFGGVSANLLVDGVDDTGTATSASTTVTVTR